MGRNSPWVLLSVPSAHPLTECPCPLVQDENFKVKHDAPGLLSMVSPSGGSQTQSADWDLRRTRDRTRTGARLVSAHNQIASLTDMSWQFFITTAPAEFLDGKHVVFGKVIEPASFLTFRKVENVPTGANNRPKLVVKITGQWPHMTRLNSMLIP